jgi:hypothetical protein
VGAALAVLARFQAAVLVVAVDQVLLHVQHPAQFRRAAALFSASS